MNQPTTNDLSEFLRKALGAQRAGIVGHIQSMAEDVYYPPAMRQRLLAIAASIAAGCDLRPLEQVTGVCHGRD